MNVHLAPGTATSVGSLPFRDAVEAAEFALGAQPDLPAIPQLPALSPWEYMLPQAVAGLIGFAVGDDGSLDVDPDRLDPDAEPVTDLDHPAFGGFRAFLAAARGRRAPVKWQTAGPVTLGLALARLGVAAPTAFRVAERAVHARVRDLSAAVTAALPGCDQVVVLDEPSLSTLMCPGFPLAPEPAIDLLSSGLSVAETTAMAGVHACGDTDWAAVLAAGPTLLSLPVQEGLGRWAGYLHGHLTRGGWIAWGVVPTDRPVGLNPDRYWRALSECWRELVDAGCDPIRLRTHALVTPACGMPMHEVGQVRQILRIVDELGDRVHGQAVATRLTIGA